MKIFRCHTTACMSSTGARKTKTTGVHATAVPTTAKTATSAKTVAGEEKQK